MYGILIVNKPSGMTSHDVVNIIRRKFDVKKVGHAGTLDPMARGVLLIMIGRATKLATTFINDDKEYIAKLFLGKKTDTQDSTGKVIEEKTLEPLDIDFVKDIFRSFIGDQEQIAPKFSAKKYKGNKFYQLTRKGKLVPKRVQKIKIYEIDLLDFNMPEILFRVRCSKGTYVRTLCEDIGNALGYPAHMSDLTRTRSGRFRLEDACELDKVSEENLLPLTLDSRLKIADCR